MEKMIRCFVGCRKLADGTGGREGGVTFVKVMIRSAETANVFCGPEVEKVRRLAEAVVNGIPIYSIKTC